MQESLLHYVWQFQYFDHGDLKTTEGDPIHVFNPGHPNRDAGPDFSNARIRIGSLEWVGNVEIHIDASGWNDHHHDADPAYDNVILHVVWNENTTVRRKDDTLMPTLTLSGKVKEELLHRYNTIMLNPVAIACSHSLHRVPDITRLAMIERALVARLEHRSEDVLALLARNNQDWEETAFQLLCRNFGFKINNDPMLAMARSLPYKVIMKHADQLTQVEALLFGQAGFLTGNRKDSYYRLLRREYNFLSQKFSLAGGMLERSQWKLLRMRPANFPTIRLAQLAALLSARKNIFSGFLASRSYPALRALFEIQQSAYWQSHYFFDKPSKETIAPLGDSSIDILIINTVVPILFTYGKSRDDETLVRSALDILQQIDAESNKVVRIWADVGVVAQSSFDSQALLELHNDFCVRKRCLDCSIGASLIRPGSV